MPSEDKIVGDESRSIGIPGRSFSVGVSTTTISGVGFLLLSMDDPVELSSFQEFALEDDGCTTPSSAVQITS